MTRPVQFHASEGARRSAALDGTIFVVHALLAVHSVGPALSDGQSDGPPGPPPTPQYDGVMDGKLRARLRQAMESLGDDDDDGKSSLREASGQVFSYLPTLCRKLRSEVRSDHGAAPVESSSDIMESNLMEVIIGAQLARLLSLGEPINVRPLENKSSDVLEMICHEEFGRSLILPAGFSAEEDLVSGLIQLKDLARQHSHSDRQLQISKLCEEPAAELCDLSPTRDEPAEQDGLPSKASRFFSSAFWWVCVCVWVCLCGGM